MPGSKALNKHMPCTSLRHCACLCVVCVRNANVSLCSLVQTEIPQLNALIFGTDIHVPPQDEL